MADEKKKVTGLVELTTPADADVMPIVDASDTTQAATGSTKWITWTNLKAGFKTYFDTLYAAVAFANAAEINTGSEAAKSMAPDQFVASNRNVRYPVMRVVEAATEWPADSTTKVGGSIPIPFTGTLVSIKGDSDTAGVTGTAIVDCNINGTTIMSTNKLKWDSTEVSTATYGGTAPALSTTAVTAGDLFSVDIDTNHTTKSKGLTITLGIRMA